MFVFSIITIISKIFTILFENYLLETIFTLIIIIVASLFIKIPKRDKEEKTLSFPIKTTIAIWWMIVIGGIGTIIFIIYLGVYILVASGGGCLLGFIPPLFAAIPIPLLISALFILFKKDKGWTYAVKVLSWTAISIVILHLGFFGLTNFLKFRIYIDLIIFLSMFLIPLILLLFDRKKLLQNRPIK